MPFPSVPIRTIVNPDGPIFVLSTKIEYIKQDTVWELVDCGRISVTLFYATLSQYSTQSLRAWSKAHLAYLLEFQRSLAPRDHDKPEKSP